jgi:hypothetical protein
MTAKVFLAVFSSLVLGCKQPEKTPEPPKPAAVTERIINPWSGSSEPSAAYQPLSTTAGVINPWAKPQSIPAEQVPLPEAFAGIPRAANLSSQGQSAPAEQAPLPEAFEGIPRAVSLSSQRQPAEAE